MGNVPAKEERRGSTSSPSRRRTNSLVQGINVLVPSAKIKNGSTFASKKQSRAEREKFKQLHAQGLLVKYDENVDGGYLAPYGTYNLNLDYTISIVKEAIIERKLAPFYTPLQEYNSSWTDDELIEVLDATRLRALPQDAEDEDEDLEYDADSVDETQLSKKELRKHLSKKFNKELKIKRIKWQQAEEDRYRQERATSKQAASRDLKLMLYRNCAECPICFLYYPKWLNYSRCCSQAICTECFVQIKRLEPHFPHDHDDDPNATKNDPNELMSEPANCPYCATPNFGVTYQAPRQIRTGLGGIAPRSFKNPQTATSDNAIAEDEEVTSFEMQEEYFRKASVSTRRGSLPVTHPTVVSTDYIRPDWETKLLAAKAKLAKRAATASAIHASSMLIQTNEADIEQRMIEEAMRLSLLDEETRKRRESSSGR